MWGLSVVSMCLTSGCEDEKKQDGVIVFGTSADYPPFEYISKGKIVGFDIDLATEIAKKMGKEAEIKNLSIGVVLVSLQNKTIDAAISALGATSERRETYEFSDTYYRETTSIVYRKEDFIRNVKQMKGRRIVAQIGTIPEKWLQEKTEAEVILMDNMNSAVEALKAAQVDGIVINTKVAKLFVEENEGLDYCAIKENIRNEEYSIVFAKDSPITTKVNKILKQMEKSGELHRLKGKWGLND
jgi:polar amino acid transport system substrate-binding protein